MSNLVHSNPNKVLKLIRKGHKRATGAVTQLQGESERNVACLSRLVDAGLVTVLLKFLSKCSTHTFEQARNGGDLESPVIWMNTLLITVSPNNLPTAQLEETRQLVAQRIGPLAQCLADDVRQELFLSNDWWLVCSISFLAILDSLTKSRELTVPRLLEEPAVLNFVVRALSWSKHRPDIVRKIYDGERRGVHQPGSLKIIQLLASQVLKWMAHEDQANMQFCDPPFSNESVARLCEVALVPVVNEEYSDATTMVKATTLADDLLDMIIQAESGPIFESLFFVLSHLTVADCVERLDVIPFLVETARNAKTVVMANDAISTLACSLVSRVAPEAGARINAVPEDGRFAVAIRAGLLETLLHTELQYHGTYGPAHYRRSLVMTLLELAGQVAVGRKTGKAIRERAFSIRSEAASARRANPQFTSEMASTVLAIVDKAVSADRGTADGSLVNCDWCELAMPKEDAKQCSRCNWCNYCSRECQITHWRAGHKETCARLKRAEGTDSLSAWRTRSKHVDRLKESINVAGAKLFSEKQKEILMQATVRGHNIVDCVVVMDFHETPPTIVTRHVDDFFDEAKSSSPQHERIQELVASNQNADRLTMMYMLPGVCVDDTLALSEGSVVLRTVPFPLDETASAGTATSWSEMQQQVAQSMGSTLDEVRSDPVRRQELLDKLSQKPAKLYRRGDGQTADFF